MKHRAPHYLTECDWECLKMYLVLFVICFICIALLLLGLYQKSSNVICTSKKRLDGKTAIITGGTTGMGLIVAQDFADRGARVIIACPFEEEGMNAQRIIEEKTGNKQVIFKLLDLSSILSVRKFAADVMNSESRVDILINNAGVGAIDNWITEDGMSVVLQINYYGHFLLTMLLLPILKKTGTALESARIVNISSMLHQLGKIDSFKIKAFNRLYSGQLYADSKFFLMLFACELTRKLNGSYVTVNSVDPGAVGTAIFNCLGSALGGMITWVFSMLSKTPWEGAQTAIHVALDEKAGTVSGQMFKDCEIIRAKGSAYDEGLGKQLWDESVKLVKLTKEELQQSLKL